MSDLSQLIDELCPEDQAVALRVLDAISRPLTVREIERALKRKGVPNSRAVITAASIKDMHIIAMVGPELG